MSSLRKDLHSTIEQQSAKISTYEAKISDLIKAYKSLQREKEALQLSLEAITCSPLEQVVSEQNYVNSDSEQLKSKENSNEEETKRVDETDLTSAKAEKTTLLKKIATLTGALKTLTAEKNLAESSLKEDRKKILDDKKKLEAQLNAVTAENTKLRSDFESKLQDFRTRVIASQHEREQETANGAVMLREVESRLSKERNEREKVEKQLDEMKEQNRQLALSLGIKSHEKKQQKQITDLQNELEQVRCRLKKAEQQCEEPPVLKKLQDQMEEMKSQYMAAILQEQLRAEAAEKSSKELSKRHEERVAALEARLTELSYTAANYDRLKQTHLQTIHTLKEKIAELSEASLNSSIDVDSETFASTSSSCSDDFRNKMNRYSHERKAVDHYDLRTLVDQFSLLWDQIRNRDNYEINCSIEELLCSDATVHQKCFSNYEELMKKYESSKTRDRDGSINSCECGLKEQLDEACERIRTLNLANHTTQLHHNQQVSMLKEEIRNLRSDYGEQISQMQQERKIAVNNLEQQLVEHCQRSLVTLKDRDDEIQRLIQEIHKLHRDSQIQPSTVAAALLSQVNCGGTEGPLLHHFEELARKDLEVSQLRKEKISLEKSMREIQMTAVDKQQQMQDTIDDLTELTERLRRNASREGENLEYLKNVVLQYMTTYDVESRQLIIRAIAAILKFTDQEKECVTKCLSLWWWQAHPSKNKMQEPKNSKSSFASGSTGIPKERSTSATKNARARYLSDN